MINGFNTVTFGLKPPQGDASKIRQTLQILSSPQRIISQKKPLYSSKSHQWVNYVTDPRTPSNLLLGSWCVSHWGRKCVLTETHSDISTHILPLTLCTTPSCRFGHLKLIMAVRCRSMWHSIGGERPLHTYRRCKGQNVACRLAGDCLHFLVDRIASSHRGGRGHYAPHHRPPTSNHGPQTLTFSRPSKIKSITLWPRTGKHCVGINHLPFHAWLCSLSGSLFGLEVMDGWMCGRLTD